MIQPDGEEVFEREEDGWLEKVDHEGSTRAIDSVA